MKGRANMKQTKRTATAELFGEVVDERDRAICLYIEWLTMGISDTKKLIERIRKDGLARMSVGDFVPALENLGRECFVSWVEDIEDRCLATPKFANAYHKQHLCYACKVGELTRAIKERSPNNQQAQQLVAAIDRLYVEVSGAIARGTTQYLTGNGNPQPADLLSDTRHGELWDSVEKAIIELSTPRSEANADIGAVVRAVLRKSEAKDIKRSQRKRAAGKIIAEYAKKKTCSFEDAAQWVLCNPTADEKRGGGYDDVTSFTTQLYKDAERLGIKDFINGKRGRPRKQKAADRRTTQAEGERPPDRARRSPVTGAVSGGMA